MRRRSAVAVGVCIAILAVAAFLPGSSVVAFALVELPWVLLPDDTSYRAPEPMFRPDFQSRSLLSLLPPRAPPAA